jgi:putative transposase
VEVSGANTHDKWLVWRTLASVPILRPAEQPASASKENLCMDKGYDYPDVREIVQWWGYTAHIRTRGEEKHQKQTIPGYRARRWVVERTHSWFNRFRRLLIRWEKKPENYLGFIHFACAWITLRASGVFG